jgi:excisionase family DNA binding protein
VSNSSPETETWLTLAKAAKQLNIHPTTLRRWADNGDIPYMRTPGGHRRFAISDIQRFAEERLRLRRVFALEQVWAQQALTQTRQEIVQRPEQSWLTSIDDETRERNRALGRRLLGLILQFIASEETNGHILAEAKIVGQEYARIAIEMGLPLTAALEASMFFRDNLMETALNLPDTARVQTEASMRLMRRVNTLLNAVHLAIADVYDREGRPAADKTS